MSTDKYRNRLITLLKELFQLDQPELDFGLYKIMHAKSVQISQFLENDLLKEIEQAFGKADGDRIAQAKAAYDSALEQAKKFGAPDPENTDGVKEAKAAYENAKDGGNAETEIYDHLYRFFERYYDSGDFMSRRYYGRESDNRAAPYAVPYDGREVYLHWANKDQYYIKSSEYLTNYTFELNEAIRQEAERQKSGQGKTKGLDFGSTITTEPRKVHLRIVGASEGEHGNIKAGNDQKRFFIIHAEEPVKLENGELVIQFQYRNDAEKSGQDKKWQQTRLDQAQEVIVEALRALPDASAFMKSLQLPAPTDTQKARTLLGKHLQKYSNRNTMDYFIHKDLGGFLRRELDFYIKNEIMRLDDIENAEAPKVEQYLAKIKVLRRIAHQLIAFLAQLENFQKKLWLKKKFVTETQYCITLDRIPESFYPEIVANDAQYQEWERLFAISQIKLDIFRQRSVEFLKANPFLLIDTAFFDEIFTAQLLNQIQEFDAQCDGILIHSENFQAGVLLISKYKKQAGLVYLDPPYNTDATPIIYKNSYKDSSWASLMADRISISNSLISDEGVVSFAIDDTEVALLKEIIKEVDSTKEIFQCVVEHYPGSGTGRSNVSRTHEYCLFSVNKGVDILRGDSVDDGERIRGFRRAGTGDNNFRVGNPGRPESFFAVLVNKSTFDIVGAEVPPKIGDLYPVEDTVDGYKRVYPIGEDGSERVWTLSFEGAVKAIDEKRIICSNSFVIKRIYYDKERRLLLPSLWQGSQYNATTGGTNLLTGIFGDSGRFSYPKSLGTMERVIDAALYNFEKSLTIDIFGGSGTTAHAIISRNKDRHESHKYILVEMGEHADFTTKERIVKCTYSVDWSSGKPNNTYSGISHFLKVVRLESYEDALNNLVIAEDENRTQALANHPNLQRDYLLNYFLDVETDGSQSLLNIDDFRDPTAYKMWIKKPGSEEQVLQTIDLIETFNWLIGLWVDHLAAPQSFSAEFDRETDPDLPGDQNTRLICKRLRVETNGEYWFRLVEGYTLRVPGDDSTKIPTLIIWRKLTDDAEKDNAALQKYLETIGVSTREKTYEVIYVNGSHTLPNPVVEGEQTKVRLTEEAFHQAMWTEA